MNKDKDIISLVQNAEKNIDEKSSRAMIIHSGAMGDCIQTLPLAKMLKVSGLAGSVAILGKTDWLEIFPARTCIDSIRSIETVDLHRLFVPSGDFELEDGAEIIDFFAGYQYIITFLGDSGSDFENNLIYTANCSNHVEVTTISTHPPPDLSSNICRYYMQSYIDQNPELRIEIPALDIQYIKPTESDRAAGRKMLSEININSAPIVIHPGSGGEKKCWHIDNYASLGTLLIKSGHEVVFLLGPAELERFSPDTLAALKLIAPVIESPSITAVLQLFSACKAYIGNDSGPSHLAAACGTKSIVLFGETKPQIYNPPGPSVKSLALNASGFNSPNSSDTQSVFREICEITGN